MRQKKDQQILDPVPFYFLRHGQTDYNVQRLFTGQHDIPLNSTGIDQARLAAQMLKNKGIQVIASSPLQRAFQTAHIVAQELQVPIVVIDDLKEGNWGVLQGKNIDDHQEHIAIWEKGGQLEEAELYTEFKDRVIRATKQALTLTHPVLIVAHGGVFEEIQNVLPLDRASHCIKNAVPVAVYPHHTVPNSWMSHELDAAVSTPEPVSQRQVV